MHKWIIFGKALDIFFFRLALPSGETFARAKDYVVTQRKCVIVNFVFIVYLSLRISKFLSNQSYTLTVMYRHLSPDFYVMHGLCLCGLCPPSWLARDYKLNVLSERNHIWWSFGHFSPQTAGTYQTSYENVFNCRFVNTSCKEQVESALIKIACLWQSLQNKRGRAFLWNIKYIELFLGFVYFRDSCFAFGSFRPFLHILPIKWTSWRRSLFGSIHFSAQIKLIVIIRS